MGGKHLPRKTSAPLVRATVAAALLTALTSCATHKPVDDIPAKLAAIDAYFTSDLSCDAKDAAAVDFAALQRDPAAYADKCIRFQAFSDGRSLSVTAKDLHLSAEALAPAHRIGVYWKNDGLEDGLRSAPSFVKVVGRMRSCIRRLELLMEETDLKAKRDHEAPHEVGLSGPCHYDDFAVLASQADVLPTAMD